MSYFDTFRSTLSVRAGAAIEGILVLMVIAAPWMFGSVHPLPELLLVAGLACILMLWAARLAVDGGPVWAPCGIGICLALLCVLGIWQITPLSRAMLRTLSPGTADLYGQMLPTVPEQVRGVEAETPPPPSTLSVAPFATHDAVFRLIAMLALFAAVRSNLTSPKSMYRVAAAVVLNGLLLSVVGIAQFFTSPRNTIFWTFATDGAVFGPFICRNHFAYWINLSMGLGLGLLLCANEDKSNSASPPGLLERPAALWIGSALTLMAAGLVCTLSRGGVVAFLSATLACLFVYLWHSKGTIRFRSGFFLAAVSLAAVTWLTSDVAVKRFATLWQTNVLDEGRGPVWTRTLGLIERFPIFGTGLGTFRFVEPLTRLPSDTSGMIHEHLHNDFLEAFIEGGLIQFALGAAIVALLLATGIRAHARLRDRPEGNLVLGALFALTAVLVHGIVDFGMHIPAVALLTTVIAALMLNVAASPSSTVPSEDRRETIRTRNPGTAACGILVLACVAFFLVDSAWRSELAERYRLAADRIAEDDPDRDQRKVAYLEAALAFTSGDTLLHTAAAEAYRERFLAQHRRWRVGLATQLVCNLGSADKLSCVALLADASLPGDDDILRALHHHLFARAACPLNVESHLFLAAYNDVLTSGEPPAVYLERACLLDPASSRSWYVAGLHELHGGNRDRAWECWRRSLMCDAVYLPPILDHARKSLAAAELLQLVFPNDPSLLLEAAKLLEKTGTPDPEAEQVLTRALELLIRQAPTESPGIVVQARVEARLQLFHAARDSYERALARDPGNSALRLELSELLIHAGHLPDARNELITILSLQPDNRKAKLLYDGLIRRLAEKSN